MYVQCGALATAQEVFDEIPVRNEVSWNILIRGYAQHGHAKEAIHHFEQMQLDGLSPDAFTFSCILKACGREKSLDKGQLVHTEILRQGFLGKDIVVSTALVDMYSKCGALGKAQEVFDELPVRNVVSWNALIAGYAQHGHGKEAIGFFEQMQFQGLMPSAATFASILKACSNIGALEKGKQIHNEIARLGLLENNVLVGTALVDMYVKCCDIEKAQRTFDNLPLRDVVSWNALIAGHAQDGNGEQAIKCYEQMQLEGFISNAVTFACTLHACGCISAGFKGQKIHAKIVKQAEFENAFVVHNALVDMYAKCGLLRTAQQVFDELLVQDTVSWNALITGYAQLGEDSIVFDSFHKMIGKGKTPDAVTFTMLLNACSHSGLVNRGQMYFEALSRYYGIAPTLDHYMCMVDLFGRSGHIKRAIKLIKEMPFPSNSTLWHTVLGACQKWEDAEVGRLAFEQMLELDEKDAPAYISLSNIYAVAGMQENEDLIETMWMKM